MTLFEYFYCKAYNYYNTTCRKSDDTLRGSALILVSRIQLFNILSILFFVSFLMKKTIGNSWIGVLICTALLVFNFFKINKNKSAILRSEMASMPENKVMRMRIVVTCYIIFSTIIFIGILVFIAYYKKIW